MGIPAVVYTVILTFVSSGPSASLQAARGTILGIVSDGSGAVIPGVAITVINEGTLQSRTMTTDERGQYEATLLPVGTYSVTAELAGFRKEVHTGIVLQVDQRARINLTLTVGEISETVQVTDQAPLVQTEDSSIAAVVERRKIIELPLNGRSFNQLATIVPGAFAPAQGTTLGFRGGFTLAGSYEKYNQYMLDGTNATDSSMSAGTQGVNIEMIREFKIQTTNYAAEYGRYSGAQIDAVSKSGENTVHGSAYYFHRNDNLDARNFFDPWPLENLPEFKRHQYGASIGGPIVRNKAFYFGAWQGQREARSYTFTNTVPTTEFRSGDLSALLRQPTPVQIRDPVSGQPFPGNIIPPERIDSRATALMKYWPQPDRAGLIQNDTSHILRPDNSDQFSGRIDYTINEKNSFFGRYSLYDAELYDFNLCGLPTIPGFG